MCPTLLERDHLANHFLDVQAVANAVNDFFRDFHERLLLLVHGEDNDPAIRNDLSL